MFRIFFSFDHKGKTAGNNSKYEKKISIVTLFIPEVVNFRLRATVNKFL